MSRRDHHDEATLAFQDERIEAIDRIGARCKAAGLTKASEVVKAIVDGLEGEMRPLVAIEFEVVP